MSTWQITLRSVDGLEKLVSLPSPLPHFYDVPFLPAKPYHTGDEGRWPSIQTRRYRLNGPTVDNVLRRATYDEDFTAEQRLALSNKTLVQKVEALQEQLDHSEKRKRELEHDLEVADREVAKCRGRLFEETTKRLDAARQAETRAKNLEDGLIRLQRENSEVCARNLRLAVKLDDANREVKDLTKRLESPWLSPPHDYHECKPKVEFVRMEDAWRRETDSLRDEIRRLCRDRDRARNDWADTFRKLQGIEAERLRLQKELSRATHNHDCVPSVDHERVKARFDQERKLAENRLTLIKEVGAQRDALHGKIDGLERELAAVRRFFRPRWDGDRERLEQENRRLLEQENRRLRNAVEKAKGDLGCRAPNDHRNLGVD